MCHCIVLSFDLWLLIVTLVSSNLVLGARRVRDRMVVRFRTTYAISVYHHWCCEFESRSGRGAQHYVIMFVSDLRQVGDFLRVLRFPPPTKLTATKYCWKWYLTNIQQWPREEGQKYTRGKG